MRTFLFVAASAVLLSCGDDSSSSSEAAACRHFLDVYCTRAVSCGDATSKSECIQASEAALPGSGGCSAVVDIRDSAELDSCIAQVQSQTCEQLAGDAPPECKGQFIF